MPAHVYVMSTPIALEAVFGLTIGEDEHVHVADGAYFAAEQRIAVEASQGPDRIAETVLHEVLHAVLEPTGLDDIIDREMPGFSEHLVSVLSPALLALIRHNPTLIEYLQETASA